ncbi:3' exoribonuclease family, domain 1 domain-containing protein [Besnoitia besnoiti]|uniref:3' exoribonuclease family, domain 1 domain-containing protein n=1 Tax=Besnoitia besnoiti TaxID=94643 RepID=A0A2A9MFE4_BESBE|nr:3' exoribonuclease family, domain 1 domain-containing protein [Besnoitia besnoiti]PFH34676.1 3' exoribonuclease family, domain 1 domain-containing protein [Besnoitia besnoiti]
MLPLCRVNAEALVEALQRQNLRADGRGPEHFRRLRISFRRSNGHAEVSLGRTRCLAQVVASPFALLPTDRASDGELSFRVNLSPSIPPTCAELASQTGLAVTLAAAEGSARRNLRSSELEKELERMLRRLLKDSGVIDTEALCIQSGRWAWHVRVAVTVVEDDGNLRDACLLAALCGLMHFKKEAVTFEGDQAVLHSAADREPLPLCIHHLPLLVSFAFLPPVSSLLNRSSGGQVKEEDDDDSAASCASQKAGKAGDAEDELKFVVDPSAIEEATLPGKVSIAVGKQGELCGMFKVGGPVLRFSHLVQLTKIAAEKAKELLSVVQAAIKEDCERQQRLLRSNAQSRYEEPCVVLALPEKHTLPLPSTSLPDLSHLPAVPAPRSAAASPVRAGVRAASASVSFAPSCPVPTGDSVDRSGSSDSVASSSSPDSALGALPAAKARAAGEGGSSGGVKHSKWTDESRGLCN